MPAPRGCCRRREPCWPRANHGNLFGGLGWPQLHMCFVTGEGINQAGGNLTAENSIQTSLITADAGVDFVRFSRSGFGDEIGICQKWTGHGDHIGIPTGNHRLCHLGRVDPIGCDDRDRHFGPQPRTDPGEGGAGH